MFLIVLLISTVLYLGILSGLFWGRMRKAGEPPVAGKPPFSLVVAARNEADHLRKLLPSLAAQHYPLFELVLILDRCTDSSVQVAESFRNQFETLKIIEIDTVPEGWSPKKYALEQGVAQAEYEWLAFTDADCIPGPNWLAELAGRTSAQHRVILGVSPYRRKPGLLNAFIRFETLYTAFQYLGMAGWDLPYMGVGRNIAYRKSFFEESGGQISFRGRLSGDDDLLVNHFAVGKRTTITDRPESLVWSEPETSFSAWRRQKMRHLSAATGYRFGSQAFLTLIHGAHAIFYVSLLFVLWRDPNWMIGLGIYGMRILFAQLMFSTQAVQWRSLDLLLWYPLLDVLYLGYNLFIGPLGLLRKPKW